MLQPIKNQTARRWMFILAILLLVAGWLVFRSQTTTINSIGVPSSYELKVCLACGLDELSIGVMVNKAHTTFENTNEAEVKALEDYVKDLPNPEAYRPCINAIVYGK